MLVVYLDINLYKPSPGGRPSGELPSYSPGITLVDLLFTRQFARLSAASAEPYLPWRFGVVPGSQVRSYTEEHCWAFDGHTQKRELDALLYAYLKRPDDWGITRGYLASRCPFSLWPIPGGGGSVDASPSNWKKLRFLVEVLRLTDIEQPYFMTARDAHVAFTVPYRSFMLSRAHESIHLLGQLLLELDCR